jgi:hypothetical protein
MSGELDETIRDPTGFEAILTNECWTGHIVIGHPEMAAFRERVLETIASPDAIYSGKRDPTSRIYAKKYAETPGVGLELTLLVYAKVESRYVATAYFAAHTLRALGEKIWPST